MNIGGTTFPAFNPYDKPAYEIYVSGCKRKYKYCQNKELQDFKYGEELVIDNIILKLKERSDLYEVISILGGDLLSQNMEEAENFSRILRASFKNKELWLFTGEEIEGIPGWCFEIFDYIKIGHYDENLKQEGFPSSSNQKLLKKGLDY